MRTAERLRVPTGTRTCRSKSKNLFVLLVLLSTISVFQTLTLAQDTIVLVGSGSSVPLPLYRKLADEFNKLTPRFQMNYIPLGTSEGLKETSRGASDFGAGEVEISSTGASNASIIELPTVVIGIVPIYNVPGVNQELKFSGELLADIFLGRVKTWNAPEIVRLNPDVTLPNLPIKVVHRPAGKGSNYIFTEFLSKTSSRFRSQIGRSASPNWPVGINAERSSDMADKVKSDSGSIGYVEQQYAVQNNIRYGSVLNPAGKFVKATPETLTAACRAVEAPNWDSFKASLTNAPGADSFPITSFTWLYLRTNLTAPRRSALANLLTWMYSSGQTLAKQAGYVELPAPLLNNVKSKANSLW